MIMWVQRCLIVPAAYADLAKSLCKELSGWDGLFESGLSADGSLPATHYVSNGLIEKDFAELLLSPGDVYALAVQRGIPVTLEQITGVLSASTISAESFDDVSRSLGLKSIN